MKTAGQEPEDASQETKSEDQRSEVAGLEPEAVDQEPDRPAAGQLEKGRLGQRQWQHTAVQAWRWCVYEGLCLGAGCTGCWRFRLHW
jgi:hypothetical protein